MRAIPRRHAHRRRVGAGTVRLTQAPTAPVPVAVVIPPVPEAPADWEMKVCERKEEKSD